MSKITIVVFFSLLCLLDSASVRRKKRDAALDKTTSEVTSTPKWTYQPSNYSDKLIDVQLRDPSWLKSEGTQHYSANSSQRGLIEVFLPDAPESLFLCFAQNTEDYRQAYVFSHVICRQLGFMTFISMNSKLSASTDDKLFYAVKPNSFRCTGQEQNISHCEWSSVNIGSCKAITELACGDCQHTLRDSSGYLEVPGYPLVNLYDVTCEWDLIIPEEYSTTLSFHHFQSLFEKSSKLFCNLQKPYVDIMYGKWNNMNYQRYCNLNDMKNMTIPYGRVKIRIFTGVYAAYGFKNEAIGKGVAITFEAKRTEISNWPWMIFFVLLFLILFIIISSVFQYCRNNGNCKYRNNSSLPMVNEPPTLADIDRAYEFQRCAIQRPLKEKMGLRLRSNGSSEKDKSMFLPSFRPDETFVVTSVDKKNVTLKENKQQHMYDETPRTIIPEIVLNGICVDEIDAIERVKVNLLDRYSKSSDLSIISNKSSTSSPVFFPSRQKFQIYSSVSSDTEKEDESKPLQ